MSSTTAKRPRLSRSSSSAKLRSIAKILGLSQTELATLFGVRQPSLAEWIVNGVPTARVANVERFYDLAQVLSREVKATRIPSIVRTPDAWLGNRSILDVVAAEGVEPIYGYLARLFSYGG
jgi:transcriptional regulator with XRE-family HTH domain